MTDWTSEAIDALWDFGDPAGTEAKFRAALADAEGLRAEELTTQVVRSLGLQQRFEEGQALLNSITPGSALVRARFALEQGRLLNSSGKPSEALPHFHAALALAHEAGAEFYAVDAAHMIAIAESGSESLDWNLKAIAMAEASADVRARGWLGSLLNNTAWSLHSLGRFDEALSVFQKALAFRVDQGRAEAILIARWCVGRCLRSLGRLEEALSIQLELVNESDDGYAREEVGEVLLAQGREEPAKPYFAGAYQVLSQDPWLREHEPDRLNRLKALGGL